jgi:hypothetical protein
MVELWGPENDSKYKKFMAEVENSAMTLGIGGVAEGKGGLGALRRASLYEFRHHIS